jgi:ABC-type hemin transport system substrate-binding protein
MVAALDTLSPSTWRSFPSEQPRRSLSSLSTLTCVIGFASLFAIGCNPDDAPLPPNQAVDERPTPRLRIASLSLPGTQLIEALGAQTQIVAADADSIAHVGNDITLITSLREAIAQTPDLLLVDCETNLAESKDSIAIPICPADLEEASALIRSMGSKLGRQDEALHLEASIGRELAKISGSSYGEARPQVIAVTGVAPLVFARHHSFSTDLIEIAGAESLAHTRHEELTKQDLDHADQLDMLLVVTPARLDDEARTRYSHALPREVPIRFFEMDERLLWLDGVVERAAALREIILALPHEAN